MELNLIHMYQGNVELLSRLVEKHARFVIVGGTAVRFFLPERQVDDLDLLIDPTPVNAELVIDAVNTGGSHRYPIDPCMLVKPNVQWPVKNYCYVDILTPKESIDFEEVWANSIEAKIANQPSSIHVRIAGISTLLTMLNSSDKPKHKEDIKLLSKLGDVPKRKA